MFISIIGKEGGFENLTNLILSAQGLASEPYLTHHARLRMLNPYITDNVVDIWNPCSIIV